MTETVINCFPGCSSSPHKSATRGPEWFFFPQGVGANQIPQMDVKIMPVLSPNDRRDKEHARVIIVISIYAINWFHSIQLIDFSISLPLPR